MWWIRTTRACRALKNKEPGATCSASAPKCTANSAFLRMRKFTLLLAGAGSGSHHFARAARSSHFAGRTSLLQRTLNLAAEDRSAKQGTVSLWGKFLEAARQERLIYSTNSWRRPTVEAEVSFGKRMAQSGSGVCSPGFGSQTGVTLREAWERGISIKCL